jgi:hypothetical protein
MAENETPTPETPCAWPGCGYEESHWRHVECWGDCICRDSGEYGEPYAAPYCETSICHPYTTEPTNG